MPFESEQQRKAMYAAAAGKSNIGIPKSVGEKFVRHAKDEADLNMWLLELYSRTVANQLNKRDADETEFPALLMLPKEKSPKYDSDILTKIEQSKAMKSKLTEIFDMLTSLKTDDDEIMVRQGKNDSVVTSHGDPKAEIGGAHPPIEMPVDKMAGPLGRASGILFLTDENEVLTIRRGNGGDFPGTWAVPGGHQNDEETLEECARRECEEETGIKYEGELKILYDDGQFCTYIARHAKKESVALNYESTGYDWSSVDTPPEPLHPGLRNAFRAARANTEYQVAELVSEDILPSPQMYANVMLLAIRITGTGLAYRSSIGEHVWRDPSLYLNDEFLRRCNGLIVIMDHPDTAVLTSKEFNKRAVGSIILPYIKGDEVWGIAKIYDEEAIKEITSTEVSTSPSVVFDETADNTVLTTENGEPLLIEGKPFLLDHIAIVTEARGSKGVWDKGGPSAGVLLTNPEVLENDRKDD